MILQKGKQYQKKINVLNRPKNKQELQIQLRNSSFIECEISDIVSQSSVDDFKFVVDIPSEIQLLFRYQTIGELFKCITGISTGKDALYISKDKKEGFEIPFYKNPGSRKFYTQQDGYITNDYLKYDSQVKNFMVRNKKYMLKEGVTCSSMGVNFSACYLPEGSTFGVNANIFCEKEDIWWLIAYLNSSLVSYIVRAILCRSNMITSGYVSKIPVVSFSQEVKQVLHKLSKDAYNNKLTPKESLLIVNEIDTIVFNELKIPLVVQEEIMNFSSNLQSRV